MQIKAPHIRSPGRPPESMPAGTSFSLGSSRRGTSLLHVATRPMIDPRRRPPMKTRPRLAVPALAAAASLALLSPAASAAVFGSLGNFDTINDTGRPAYGFEIDIEDSSFDHTKITSVFGYDRVFSFISPDPGAVVRFGKPTITDVPGYGVKIVYGGTIGGVATPFNDPLHPFTTGGESCWPGANKNWTSNPCDHFGVSTYGNPAAIKYSWITDTGNQPISVPSVRFVPQGAPGLPPPPPAPGVVPPAVLAVIQAPAVEPAYWVKLTQTTIGENIDLGDLLIGGNGKAQGGHDEIAGLNEQESEWYPLQIGKVDELSKELKPNKDPSVVIDMKFYKYQGLYDDEGVVDPQVLPQVDADNHAYIMLPDAHGVIVRHDLVYVGQQIGGFNAYEGAPPIPVPEPGSWALLAAGLGVVGLAARRARS
ncbi:MAG: PEP-CTERM sorting domain-containing protein [Burkholderiaceae bacterium]|nr:PEP-CTERM sorting domain-containing protein [Burkholderiaceae bacterium]